jgi:hypothetical protein
MSIHVTCYGNRRQNLQSVIDDNSTIQQAIAAVSETVEANQEVRVNGELITDMNRRLEAGKPVSIQINSKNKGSRFLKRLRHMEFLAWAKAVSGCVR